MKQKIEKKDINNVSDMIVELPTFRNLKSKENIKDLLKTFIEDLYVKGTEELINVFDFKVSDKLVDTVFKNYNIDKEYTKKIQSDIKKDLIFLLEQLHQYKGSRKVFEIFASLFKNVFRRLNFYNVVVYKIPRENDYQFEYRLNPIYISDPEHVIEEPQIEITKTRKYLMDLPNFVNYTVWPMTTNLVYIQFVVDDSLINNEKLFSNGVRAFAATYLYGKKIKYSSRYVEVENNQLQFKNLFYEEIDASDLELLLTFFKITIVKIKNPEWDFNAQLKFSTYLPHHLSSRDLISFNQSITLSDVQLRFLYRMQQLLEDYATAKRNVRSEMENLRRRWQFFLREQERENICFENYGDFLEKMRSIYPKIIEEFLTLAYYSGGDRADEEMFKFYMRLYTAAIATYNSQQEDPQLGLNSEWVLLYIDVIFAALFIEANFLENYVAPVLDLFSHNFFPVDADFIADFIEKSVIKDKWNSVSYDCYQSLFIKSNAMTLWVMPPEDIQIKITVIRKEDPIADDYHILRINKQLYEHLRRSDDRYQFIFNLEKKETVSISDYHIVEIIDGEVVNSNERSVGEDLESFSEKQRRLATLDYNKTGHGCREM